MKTALIILSILVTPCLLSAQTAYQYEHFPNGEVSKIIWNTDDVVHFIKYHENGRVQERGTVLDGKNHGRWTQFDPQGRRTARVQFDHGKRTGTWVLRTLDGLNHRLQYRDGKLMHGEEFTPDGVLVAVRDQR